MEENQPLRLPDTSPPFRFHHTGLACRKLEPEIAAHMLLGYEAEGDVFCDPTQRIRGIFMVHGLGMRIELLEPAEPNSPVSVILARGQKMYHQAFECPDILEGVRHLERNGARIISPPAPAVAFQGRRICFILMKTMLVVELIEAAEQQKPLPET